MTIAKIPVHVGDRVSESTEREPMLLQVEDKCQLGTENVKVNNQVNPRDREETNWG